MKDERTYCEKCHEPFAWPDEMAAMALKDKRTNRMCKKCRRKFWNENFKETAKQFSQEKRTGLTS
jgi:RNase P subunit RPR2